MTAATPMAVLYSRLVQSGLPKKYVRETILPEWWDDQVATSPAGYAQALGILAKHLGLSLPLLRDESQPLVPPAAAAVAFKNRAGTNPEELGWTKSVALRVAALAARITKTERIRGRVDEGTLRRELLTRDGRWCSLDTLLDWCWDAGIAVVHVSRLPAGKKMEGLATLVGDRPVIVLSKSQSAQAWLLFHLAHELGHVMRGHLASNEAIFDDEFKTTAAESGIEQEATDFGLRAIAGKANPIFAPPSGRLFPKTVANAALQIAGRAQIDPGLVVLAWCFRSKVPWRNGQPALPLLDHRNGMDLIRDRMLRHVDLDRLSNDEREFFLRLTTGE